jgi:hypothetical protein
MFFVAGMCKIMRGKYPLSLQSITIQYIATA